ncbi:hypothetical protein BA065_00390 [Nanoarchaeota archaeon NZ13-N]|nr:MAG: hypothetical protein BA065_00390 [Nanoarchaeota archaeon NZ13-N]
MKLEKPEIHWKALDVLANQIVGLTIDFGEIEVNKAFETIKRCYVYKDLTYEEFLEVLNFLNEIKLVKFDEEGRKIVKTRKGHMYYIENLSMIPDEKSYDVIDVATRMKIGVLHEEFVAKHGNPGTVFILRGLPWKIEKVEKDRIFVSLEKDFESAIPSWEGELLPVPFEVAIEAHELKADFIGKVDELRGQDRYFIPSSREIYIEQYKDWFVIHSPFGTKVNDALSRIISHFISQKYGIVVGIKTDPYRIILKAGYIKKKNIKEVLESLPEDIEDILESSVVNTDLFLWKFSHVAKRFGVIRKDADYSKSTLRRILQHLIGTPVYRETLNEIFIEKFDIENTKKVIRMIKSGEIKVEISLNEIPSPLAAIGLEEYVSDVLISDKWREIVRLVKERLYETEFTLVCMACKSKYKIKVKDYDEGFKCERCGGNYFGVAKSEEDIYKEDKLYITADMLKTYGRRFLFVYAGRGISYISAIGILRKNIKDEDELVKEVIEFEKKSIKFSKRKY